MKVAIIPARGGSRRIARKNVREFAGRPIINWSIQAASKTGLFDRIIVSTDDDEIAQTAENAGASVPFRRPESLSDDQTGTLPVIAHAVQWIQENDGPVDDVCCLYATAPFATPANLSRGHSRLSQGNWDYAFSVTSYAFAIQRAIRMSDDGVVSMFNTEHEKTRSQDLEPAFHDAGQFYWARAETFLAQKPIFSGKSAGIVIERHLTQDIDTEEDWLLAELMFETLKTRGLLPDA